MDAFVDSLPRIGAFLTLIIGLVGFFKPRLITAGVNIVMDGPVAISEVRGALGGYQLGISLYALLVNEPLVYMGMAIAWVFVTLARFYSMMVDKTTFKQSIPALVVDGSLSALFLSGFF
jgi:hypothetical protein